MQHTQSQASNGTPGRRMQSWLWQNLLLPVIQSALLLLIAGQLDWFWGWVFGALYIASSLVTWLLVRDPALIAEREQRHANEKGWDVRFVRLYGLLMLAVTVVAGLDRRFGWTPPLPVWVHLAGVIGVMLTAVLGIWAMRVNTFFSSFVRIQSERDHHVIDDGPYRFVRHPGNLTMIVWVLAQPLLLGTLWALVPAVLATVVVVVRTQREDATLAAELRGYSEYAARVRFRLLPGIW